MKEMGPLKPGVTEPICLISYEITNILLGGGPETRTGFWKAYRHELKLNKKTRYKNYHVELCRHHLTSLKLDLSVPVFYREGRLTTEKEANNSHYKGLFPVARPFPRSDGV